MRLHSLGHLPSAFICVCAVLSALACRPTAQSVKTEPPPAAPRGVTTPDAEDERIASKVKEVVLEYSRRGRRAVPAKEAVAAMAAVVGERSLDAAGEVSVRGHDLVPGQRVFSDKVNALLAGDDGTAELAQVRGGTVFGTIRDQLAGGKFRQQHFPSLHDIFRGFAGRIGKPEDWGKVPLSLPAQYWPEQLPLRVAFDTRAGVDAALRDAGEDKVRRLRACALAMALTLKDESLADQLDPAVALTLTFEMINGMAKTAPMTDKAIDTPTQAMREAQHQVIRIEPRAP